jgi:hypothetical protein
MIFYANGTQTQAGVPILIFNKTDFIAKLIKRDKESHFLLVNNPSRQDNRAGDVAQLVEYLLCRT